MNTHTLTTDRRSRLRAAWAAALDVAPERALFLTDHPDEVAAALAAGWQVVAPDRAGEPWAGADFAAPSVASFDEIEVTR